MMLHGKKKAEESADAPAPKKSSTLLKNVANVVAGQTKQNSKLNIPTKVPESGEYNVMSQPNDVARTMISTLKKILENNFKDPVERLNLNFIPPCLFNLKRCAQRHSKKSAVPETSSYENQYIAKEMLVEDRHFQFVKFVTDMCGRNEFPGSGLVLTILEQILILQEKGVKTEVYPLNDILDDLHCLFNQILLKFSPCILKNSYLQAFTMSMDSDLIDNTSEGIFSIILDLLSDCINSQPELDSKVKRLSLNKSQTDKLNNFYAWELEYCKRARFEDFDRDVKIDRIFRAMDLIVKVLEIDFTSWMIKYSSKMCTYMNRSDRCPMIACLIYQNFDHVLLMNSKIKNIIAMFVDMVALGYPEDKLDIFARLLNLIATVINLREYPDDTIAYPTYKNVTIDFVNGIKRAIENSKLYSFKLYLKVASLIKTPIVQMLLCNLMLQRVDKISDTPSLQQIFDVIRKKSFLECAEASSRKETAKSVEKYPVFEKKKGRGSKFEIYQDEYLKLLLIYAKSIIDVYRIQDYSKEIKKQQSGNLSQLESSVSVNSLISQKSIADTFNFDDRIYATLTKNIDLNEKIQLNTKDNKFRKQIHIRLSKDECKFYRDETKYYLLLKNVILTCFERYGSLFNEWMRYVKSLDN